MNYQFIKVNQLGGVLEIRLNRPEVLNSFVMPMAKELQEALDTATNDTSIRSVLLTGEGRGFCAGQDLAEAIQDNGPKISEIVHKTYNPIITKIRDLEKPVICAVNGVAAGAGANIAFACDITLAAESASFVQAFSKIGLIPDSAGTYFLPRLIGVQKATALMMLAEKLPAIEAEKLGLIYKVVADSELYTEAFKIADSLANMPTVGLGLTKRAINLGLNNNLIQQLEVEAVLQELASESYDHKEGVKAFLEKRKPEFKGE
jgi:2-(1,2-epoxy-1,2-dihydrophenyl)acetyl-CoA isomerase